MRARTGDTTLWRVLEVVGSDGGRPSSSGFRVVAGGINIETVATHGAQAIATVRVDHAPARRVWLYEAACRRRPTRASPNGVLAPPLAEAAP